jgi:hypothetical protein
MTVSFSIFSSSITITQSFDAIQSELLTESLNKLEYLLWQVHKVLNSEIFQIQNTALNTTQ